MKFFKKWFGTRDQVGPPGAEETAEKHAREKRMLEMAKEKSSELPLSQENGTAVIREETSVTGIYKTVASAIEDAVGEKRKAREAAQRVSSAIGVPPPSTPPKPKAS